MLIIFKKNKLISLLLAFVLTFSMLFSTAIPAYATDINSSGNSGKSKVVTTVTPAKFSVTVPYLLPISIDADQNVYTADNVAISNNSNGPIKVSDATLTTNEGWELVADGTDFSSVPVNSKQFTMRVLNSPVLTSGNLNTESFGTINGNSSLTVNYSADAAVQGEELSATNIANVLFTIEWDNVVITSATVSKTALQSFVKTVTTFQKTSERLNIDDVKATDGVTKIDNGATDKSIYAWADSNGNGYWWTDAMIAHLPDDCSKLFYQCTKLRSLDLTGYNTSNVTNMSYMFGGCVKISYLGLSDFDTVNVTDMSYMFDGMKNILRWDFLNNFDTSNVTNMSYMFANGNYREVDLSNFDTSKVTNMSYMFFNSTNSHFVTVDLSDFNTSNVKNMKGMFEFCSWLETINLSGLDTSNVTDMSEMFFNIVNLTTIYVSDFNTAKAYSNKMFYGDTNLVGGNGTRYNSSFTDKTYARIDTAETPGYFTYKAAA